MRRALPATLRAALVPLALALAGCAPLPAQETPPVPRRTTPAAETPARRTGGAAGAAVDSTPSREALEVLSTIPEPLPPGERVPPPETPPAPAAATPDSSSAAPDSTGNPDEREVPVPEPTLPLGQRPPRADSSTAAPPGESAPSSPPPAAPPPASPPPAGPPPSAASGDTCWRVQIAAPLEKGKAESAREAATSLLLVPMTVDREAGRWKVRNRDCLTREQADLLRRRAIESGFPQAFRVRVVKK